MESENRMPSKPKLTVKTPDDENYNALIGEHPNIVSLPRERRYAIVEFITTKVDLDVASGEQQASVALVQIEIPRSQADEVSVVALLDKMFKSRTHLTARADPYAGEDTPLDGLNGADLGNDGVE